MSIFSLADLRAQAPNELQSLDDVGLIKAFSDRTGKDPMQVAEYLGYRQNQGMGSARVSSGVDNYQAGLFGLGEAVAGSMGLDGASKYLGDKRRANELDAQIAQQRASNLGAVDDWRNVDGVGSGLNYLGGLAAQSLPYLGEAVAGGLTGGVALTGTAAKLGIQGARAANAARTAGAVGASYPSAVGDILQNQRDENGTTDLGFAALGGVPYAALNAFGIEGLAARGLKPLAQFDGNILARMGKQGAVTALSEGASETGQELINQSFGRMAVNPEQTLFNEDANARYLDSFVGGAALGGSMGSLSGIRRQAEPAKPTVEQQPDLLDRAGEPLGIGFSGYDTGVGQIIAFPDGSSMLRSEWDQLAREGRTPDLDSKYPGFLRQYGQADGPLFGSAGQPQEGGALGAQPGQLDLFNPNGTATYNADADSFAPNATPNLVTQLDPLQQRIDQNLGINRGGFAGKGYPKQFEAAASEPTNAFAIDPSTGMERRLDIGQLTAAQASGADLSPVQREVQARAQTKLADHKAKQRTAAELGLDPKNVQHTEATGLLMMAMQNGVLDENQALDVAGTIVAAAQQPELGKPLTIARKAVKAAEKAKATVAKQDAAQDAYETKLLGPSVQLGTTGSNTGAPQPAAAAKTTAPAAPAAAPSVPGGTAPAVAANNGAVTTQQPEKTVTVGRKGREKALTKEELRARWRAAPDNIKRRIEMATGVDLENDANTGEAAPWTFEEIAAHEGVTKQAVQQSLAAFGITEQVADAVMGAAPVEYTASDLGLEGEGGQEAAGMRVEDTLSKAAGQGLVEGETETLEQRKARLLADRALKNAPAKDKREAYDPAKDEARAANEKRAAEALVRDIAVAEQLPEGRIAAQLWDNLRSEDSPEFGSLTPKQKYTWFAELADYQRGVTDGKSIEGIQRSVEAEVVKGRDGASEVPGRLVPAVTGAAQGAEGNRQAESGGGVTPDAVTPVTPEALFAAEVNVARGKSMKASPMHLKLVKALLDAGLAEHPQVGVFWKAITTGAAGNAKAFIEATKPEQTNQAQQAAAGENTLQTNPRLEANLRAQLRGFDRFGQAPADTALAMRQVEGMLGVNLRIGVETVNTLPDYAPAAYNRDTGKIELNSNFSFNQASLVEVLVEEVLHAVDSLSGNRLLSASTKTFMPGGTAYTEATQAVKSSPVWKSFLAYPLDTTLNASRVAAELFARLGAAYAADPAAMKAAMPQTYEVYHGIFGLEQSPGAGYVLRTRAWRELVRGYSLRGDNAQGTRVAQRLAERSDGKPTDQKLGQLRAAVVQGFGARADGAFYGGGLNSELLPTQRPSALTKPSYMDKAPSELWDTAKGAMLVVKDWAFTRGAFTQDLLTAAAKMMPAARTYLEQMQAAGVESRHLQRQVADIVDRAANLSAAERGTGPVSINKLISDMTYDNKWAFKPDWYPQATVDPVMKSRFNALSPEARKVVVDVFKQGHESLLAAQRAAIESIASEVDPLIAAAKASGDMATVKELEKAKVEADGKFRRLVSLRSTTPYAPLRRFGNWAVVVKSKMYQDAQARKDTAALEKLARDGNHYHVEFVSNQLVARSRAKELQAEMGDAKVEHFERADDNMLYGGESMFKAFSRFRTLAREKMDGESTQVVSALDKTLASMYMSLIAETSARTSEFSRKNTRGASEDMMKAFATQGLAMAHFIGSLKTSGKIMETLRTLKGQSSEPATGDRAEASKMYNEIMRRHAMGMDYEPNQWLDKSLAFNSYWSLITSPSYLLTNLTQPWVVSVPVLAGKFGMTASMKAMGKAYGDVAKIATKLVDNPEAVRDLPPDVQAAVQTLFDRGRIDISLGADLGSFSSPGDSDLSAAAQKAIRFPRTLVERGEMVNRVATAVAAYRLAKQRGMSVAEATDYADKVIYDTHGDYSAFNAPRVMRTGLGRFATQFRKFQLIQLSMYARLIHDARKGMTVEERTAARAALGYSLGTMFALGGVVALPGYTAISFLLGSVLGFGDDDEPDDPEATLRRFIGNEAVADLLVRGVPNAMGLNLGNRLGAAGMLSILPYTDLEASRDGYKDILLGLAGPFVGGTLPKALDGVGLMASGDYWKGLEMLLPRGLADAAKGVRFADEGLTKRNGDVVLSRDEINWFEASLQAVGLPTTDITNNQMLRNSQFKADEFYKDRTSELKKAYVEAYRSGDGAELQEIRQRWADTQKARKELGFEVQPLSTLIKAPQEQKKREAKPMNLELVQ